jgi:alginate O-acetylation protein algI
MSKDSIKVIKKALMWILKWAIFTAFEFLILYVAIISWDHDFAQFMHEYSNAIIPFIATTAATPATMIRNEGTIFEVKD